MENFQNHQISQRVLPDKWGQEFANSWLMAWNSKDVDQIVEFYSSEFVMVSPTVRQMTDDEEGVLINKEEMRGLCSKIFKDVPELQFSLAAVAVGVESLTIHYTNHQCDMVAEVMRFNDNWKITKSHTYY